MQICNENKLQTEVMCASKNVQIASAIKMLAGSRLSLYEALRIPSTIKEFHCVSSQFIHKQLFITWTWRGQFQTFAKCIWELLWKK